VRTLGALVGLTERAETLAAGFEARLAEAEAAARSRPPLRVYFEEWDAPMISGIGWVSDLIGLAGGRDVFPALSRQPAA
ncbi:cobalamin-binding protein, partial [Pseudomonas sp. FW305-130]